MARGDLPVDAQLLLEPGLRSYLDHGSLFAGDVDGVLTWIIEHFGDWYYGPIIGPAFTESVLTGWQRYDPTKYVPPIA